MLRKTLDRFCSAWGLAFLVFLPCACLIGANAYHQIRMGWMSLWASAAVSLILLAVLILGLWTAAAWADRED